MSNLRSTSPLLESLLPKGWLLLWLQGPQVGLLHYVQNMREETRWLASTGPDSSPRPLLMVNVTQG